MLTIVCCTVAYFLLYVVGINRVPTRPRPHITTIEEAIRDYYRDPATVILTELVCVFVLARWVRGDWGYGDVLAAVTTLVAWPFIEWISHMGLLHRGWLGMRLVHNHHTHHRYPEWPETGITPLYVLWGYTCAAWAAWYWYGHTRPWVGTVVAVLFLLLQEYEWFHFLTHTDYKITGRWSVLRRKRHLLHHYHNDDNWYGVTRHGVDAMFGTAPPPGNVAHKSVAIKGERQ